MEDGYICGPDRGEWGSRGVISARPLVASESCKRIARKRCLACDPSSRFLLRARHGYPRCSVNLVWAPFRCRSRNILLGCWPCLPSLVLSRRWSRQRLWRLIAQAKKNRRLPGPVLFVPSASQVSSHVHDRDLRLHPDPWLKRVL